MDQDNPSRASACGYTGWIPDDWTHWAAQTFTAGRSGKLTEIVVWLRDRSAHISVVIVPVNADGKPIVATPIASTGMAFDSPGTWTDVRASFANPARVEAGTQYAVVLSSPAPDLHGWAWKADLGSSVVDPRGRRCADGTYGGGRFHVSSEPTGADADFFFQTYVRPDRRVIVDKTGTGSGLIRDATAKIDCGAVCASTYVEGDTVTFTATPDAGSTFSSWFGSCSGTQPTCSVSVGADTQVTAEFTRKPVTLTIRRIGGGLVTSLPPGITCGRVCTHRFAPGPVTLTASPSEGWRFARWQGGCHGTRPVCRFDLQRAGSVSARFTKIRRNPN